MTNRKFYETKVVVTVLSETPLTGDYNLEQLHYAITDGECSGQIVQESTKELNGREAAEALAEQGSDPSFFGLTEDGEDDKENADGYEL